MAGDTAVCCGLQRSRGVEEDWQCLGSGNRLGPKSSTQGFIGCGRKNSYHLRKPQGEQCLFEYKENLCISDHECHRIQLRIYVLGKREKMRIY